MITALKRLFIGYRAEDHEGIETPPNVDATFSLRYGDLPVGSLSLHNGAWKFHYSREFRAQYVVKPLVDFPDPDKEYRSQYLWPFFMARIPSVAQPQVKETIEQEGLDQHSDVQLLKRFGERTISNPFVLEPA